MGIIKSRKQGEPVARHSAVRQEGDIEMKQETKHQEWIVRFFFTGNDMEKVPEVWALAQKEFARKSLPVLPAPVSINGKLFVARDSGLWWMHSSATDSYTLHGDVPVLSDAHVECIKDAAARYAAEHGAYIYVDARKRDYSTWIH